MPKSSTTRWCPTAEQLLVLEKLYRSGMKTPNALQIHQITAFLSPYGRIEGKNVFYWFQNHKARERQRLKKRLISQQQQQQQSNFSDVSRAETSHPLLSLELPLPPPLPPPFHIPIPHPCIFHPQMVNQELGPAMNPQCKMEASDHGGRPLIPEIYEDGQVTHVGRLRPLVTLDLFPTKSTGLKDECSPSNSKASSSSMFTSSVDQI